MGNLLWVTVGSALGNNDGVFDGTDVDGLPEGPPLGEPDGPLEGPPLGDPDGASVNGFSVDVAGGVGATLGGGGSVGVQAGHCSFIYNKSVTISHFPPKQWCTRCFHTCASQPPGHWKSPYAHVARSGWLQKDPGWGSAAGQFGVKAQSRKRQVSWLKQVNSPLIHSHVDVGTESPVC